MMEGEISIYSLHAKHYGLHNEEPRIWLRLYRKFRSIHMARYLEQKSEGNGFEAGFLYHNIYFY